GGGHGFRSGAGKLRGDQDRRKVDVGQIAHRQTLIGHEPEEQDGAHAQRGEDRAADEECGTHDDLGALTSTRDPGTRRSCPSVTTRSPAPSPCSITRSRASRRPGFTGRASTVWSAFTTKTKGPFWPAWLAAPGTPAAFSVVGVGITSTACPGHSALSVFGKVALS